MSEINVVHNPAKRRFEIVVDGVVAGFTRARDADGVRTFPHTEVDDAYQGQGLSGRLIGEALAATRDAGLQINPVCPAVIRYISKNPEYAELIPTARRAELGL